MTSLTICQLVKPLMIYLMGYQYYVS